MTANNDATKFSAGAEPAVFTSTAPKLCMSIAKIRVGDCGLLARSVVVDDSKEGGSVIRCGAVVGPDALCELWFSTLLQPGGARTTFESDGACAATFDRCRISLVQHGCVADGLQVRMDVVIISDTPVAAAVVSAARLRGR